MDLGGAKLERFNGSVAKCKREDFKNLFPVKRKCLCEWGRSYQFVLTIKEK